MMYNNFMNPTNAYKFCPRCSGNLLKRKENLLVCRSCQFEFYINALPCNAAILENEKGEILLVKRKFNPQKGKWDWPGGFLDGGEALDNSVKRELKEELNVDIKIKKLIGVYEDKYEFQGILYPAICMVVLAEITGGNLKASDDVEGYKFFPPEEVLKMDLAFESIKKGVTDYLKLK